MRSKLVVVALSIVGIGLGVVTQEVPLVQPSELPPDQRGRVLAAISSLEEILADWRLGCGGAAVRLSWSEYQLARFVAGRRTGLGYPSRLARAGEEWWVLVRVGNDQAPFWVPVVPGIAKPEDEKCYQPGVFLGHVPWDGQDGFLPQYLSPEEVLPLPPNRLPQGKIRFTPLAPRASEKVRFFGSRCADPDGVIVTMIWDFGDGETSTALNPTHVYDREGDFTVTLTLVDDGGAEVQLTKTVKVREEVPSEGGCNCGD